MEIDGKEQITVRVEDVLELRECLELGMLMSNAFEEADVLTASEDFVDLRFEADVFNEIMLRINFPRIESKTEH